MGDINKEAVDSILKAVEIIIDKKLQDYPFLIKQQGRVMKKNNDSTYQVRLQASDFNLTNITPIEFNVGDAVTVLTTINSVADSTIIGRV